jgi:vacuolar-type H+-ATPase subunit I/STV1
MNKQLVDFSRKLGYDLDLKTADLLVTPQLVPQWNILIKSIKSVEYQQLLPEFNELEANQKLMLKHKDLQDKIQDLESQLRDSRFGDQVLKFRFELENQRNQLEQSSEKLRVREEMRSALENVLKPIERLQLDKLAGFTATLVDNLLQDLMRDSGNDIEALDVSARKIQDEFQEFATERHVFAHLEGNKEEFLLAERIPKLEAAFESLNPEEQHNIRLNALEEAKHVVHLFKKRFKSISNQLDPLDLKLSENFEIISKKQKSIKDLTSSIDKLQKNFETDVEKVYLS